MGYSPCRLEEPHMAEAAEHACTQLGYRSRQELGGEDVSFFECTSGQEGCPDFPCAVALGSSVLVLHTVPYLSHKTLQRMKQRHGNVE